MFVFNALTMASASHVAVVARVLATLLVKRDVIRPKILKPDANTVWTCGWVETVSWWAPIRYPTILLAENSPRDTPNFPPSSQISNPIGKVILGHQGNNSLNLDTGEWFLVGLWRSSTSSRPCVCMHLYSKLGRYYMMIVATPTVLSHNLLIIDSAS